MPVTTLKSLRKNRVKTTQEFLDRADKYIKLEEAIANEGKPLSKPKKNDSKPDNSSNKNGANINKNNNKGKRS